MSNKYELACRVQIATELSDALQPKLSAIQYVIEEFFVNEELYEKYLGKKFRKYLHQEKRKGKQKLQKDEIDAFKEALCHEICEADSSNARWGTEKLVSDQLDRADRADICTYSGPEDNLTVDDVIVELDKHRSDQVAKKFISRIAAKTHGDLLYVALCYPGTQHMSVAESVKYLSYCSIIAEQLNSNENRSIGFIGYLILDSKENNNKEKVIKAIRNLSDIKNSKHWF